MGKMYSLTANGLQDILPVTLEKYTLLIRNTSEHGELLAAVIDDPAPSKPQRCVTISATSECFFFYIENRFVKPYSKKFGIGTYYLDDLSKAEPDLVENFIRIAELSESVRKEKAEAKRIADEKERNELPSKFPHLTPIEQHPKGNDFACCIENIRKELKLKFPSVKFSVRKENYNCIYVSWIDGPTNQEVDELIKKFEDHENDVSGDFRDYSPSNFNKVFGGSKYVFSSREKSPETASIFSHWANEQFRCDSNNDTFGCHYPVNLAHKLFYHCPVYPPFRIVPKETDGGAYAPESFWTTETIK